jgi:Mut7-C RNAse domain
VRLKWADTGSLEIFDAGYARRYKNGHVFWSYEFGTRTTVGAIDDFCMANDVRQGFPADDQKAVRSMSGLTDGIMQRFELGVVYSSKYGTYFVSAHSSHEEEGGVQGWLGFPMGEEGNGNLVRLQKFECGTVYTFIKEAPESFALPQEIADALPYGWRPVSKEAPVKSSSGKRQTAVQVEGETESGTYEGVVHWDEKDKPACNGPLGPVAKAAVAPLLPPGTRRTYQTFSGCRSCGQVYWHGAHSKRLGQIIDSAVRAVSPGTSG